MRNFFKKLLNQGQDYLSKFKVLHQILIVIGIMAVFLVVQGYISIAIINTMQKMHQKAFDSNIRGLYNIAAVKQDLQQFRINYMEGLSQSSLYVMSNTALERTENRIRKLEGGNRKTADAILKKLEETREILSAPISNYNYRRLETNLKYIIGYLNILENVTRNAGISAISNSTVYSGYASTISGIILALSLLISAGIGLVIAVSISRPLKEMLGATKSLAVGDLSKTITVTGCSEISGMAQGLSQAITGLRVLIKGINEQAKFLVTASDELKAASANTSQSASQVAMVMQEMAQASTDQTIQVNQAVQTIDRLSELVKKVSSDIENITMASQKAAKSAEVGQQATGTIADEINDIFNSTREVAEVVNELSQTSQEIGEIISVIQGIAEQTTLLSLNASIEAARAGEQGKGFEVVAQETGKLADQSKQAAKMIVGLIEQMKNRSELVANAIKKDLTIVEGGKNLTTETTKTFAEIFEVLIRTMAQIDSVAKLARQMLESNENANRAITNIAALSEESMASAQEVSANSEEQSASLEQVTALAENLLKIANDLKFSVAAFKT